MRWLLVVGLLACAGILALGRENLPARAPLRAIAQAPRAVSPTPRAPLPASHAEAAPPPAAPRSGTRLRVLDAAGRPVANARVRWWFRKEGRTGPDGGIDLPVLTGDTGSPRMSHLRTTVTVHAEGWAPMHVAMFRGPWEPAPEEVRLTWPGVPMRLRYVDGSGDPLRDAWVSLNLTTHWMPEYEATTDDEGRLPTFDARPVPHEVNVPPGRYATPATVMPGGGEQTIVVHRLARVEGRFTPAPPRRGFTVPLPEGRTIDIEADGTFTLRAVAGTCALYWAERGAFLASFDLAPGEVREDVEIVFPYK